ncbi:hypothetical protein Tcan_14953 [Toxocara canis]|uniref:Uncharacterized protein n=1 Tax=Toxocara canis TaxID=6265 RepID=A0A0B2V4Z2_TOXCA|nr:hypothetical protein Tcan_14953 [Toxocara canis]
MLFQTLLSLTITQVEMNKNFVVAEGLCGLMTRVVCFSQICHVSRLHFASVVCTSWLRGRSTRRRKRQQRWQRKRSFPHRSARMNKTWSLGIIRYGIRVCRDGEKPNGHPYGNS